VTAKRQDLSETEAVDRFIDSLDFLNQEQLLGMTAAWRSADTQAREDAWTKVRATAAIAGLSNDVEHVRDRAMHWAARGTNTPSPYTLTTDDQWGQVRRAAAPALADAAIAIALGNRLDEATRDVLLGPWLRVSDQG
jgi:hypothetical protein